MAFSRHGFTRGGLQSLRAYAWICMAVFAALVGPQVIGAQVANRLPQSIDTTRTFVLQNHHPQWASAANSVGAVPADAPLNQFTLVLSRTAAQEEAFEQLLANQQNPASPEYHHWLTPLEVGARFGVSDADVAAIEGWLQSQGLHVNWVSASRIFVGFGGSASNVGRAFGTELRYYNVNGAQRMSVTADPVIPRALVPVLGSIRGLYDIDDRPAVRSSIAQSVTPEMNLSNGTHFVSPKDFVTIYDVPASYTGAGVTVGIVSWSRTNFADFANFKSKTGTSFQNPTEIVPTAFGGIDPGPAYTTQQSCITCLDGQTEATLDVERVGSTAQEANILLMVSSPSGSGGGIGADAQYLVNTDPVPAQVMSISFGGCEANAGPSGVAYWNSIFQQAAGEGISVFVSSGDSGAAGCDAAFSAPPSSPGANSPNYICSSQYATCMGGTQFNDSSGTSTYWNSRNGSGLASAIGYIPEGGWNESTPTSVAASGGGVSRVIPTPWWQTGTGVPAERTGRYTPDLSFTSAGHDGYFGCMAAGGGSCEGSPFNFIAFEGTSATAPGMAGIAALLDQRLGSAQGNLNPEIYAIAASNPAAFHDVTVETSGVAGCHVNTASMCNNSIPPPANRSRGQAGYLVGDGYDEVTGLGSLDVDAFLNSIAAPPTIKILATPSSLTFPTEFLGYSATAQLVIQNSGSTTLNALAISIDGANAGDFSQTSDCQSSLNAGSGCTIQVTFKPTAAGSRTAGLTITSSNASNSPQGVPLTGTGSNTRLVPSMFAFASPTTATTAQLVTVSISAVHPEAQYPTPTGTVQLTAGGYVSSPVVLISGNATVNIPAGALPLGTDLLVATYAPDAASSTLYQSTTANATVTVNPITKLTPTVMVTPTPANLTTVQALSVAVTVSGGSGNPAPTGTVNLASGSYSLASTALSNGNATINISADTLAVGSDQLIATYTPDSSSSGIYNSATGSNSVTVMTAPIGNFAITGTSLTINSGANAGNASTITVTPLNGFTGPVALTAIISASPTGAANLPTLSFGSTTPVNIAGATAGTATLTVSTNSTQQGSCTASSQPPHGINWYSGGGILACLLLFGIGPRRRRFRAALGMLALLVALTGGMLACGGIPKAACTNTTIPGTTAGNYTVTVTGTSGSITASGTVTLTVQ
jgi:hypothetical protein